MTPFIHLKAGYSGSYRGIIRKYGFLSVKIPLVGCMTGLPFYKAVANEPDLPNILWITSEDNSPLLGCYGDAFATTPNLDKLASEGFIYTHAYANAPVSAPVRNTIITGIYACSGGNHHMRSRYAKSDVIRCYPEFLRNVGYYCTNNSKEDYNIAPDRTKGIWDESSNTAHYRNRKSGQPFFAVFNSNISHESCIHKSIPSERLRHSPVRVTLPPYHPDTPEMRHDWAQYYDKVEDMDAWVGDILRELEESGEADNTIVFYYSDHGGVQARSKRFTYETGTRVPFIVRIPEKYKQLFPAAQPGVKADRMVGLVDLAPTLLSIAGIRIPEWMQGHAFLGRQTAPDPQYVYMFRGRMDERYDMTRAVRDSRYRYIRNYMPHRIYGQHVNYLWLAPSVASWEQAYLAGECNREQSVFWETKPPEELYDTENDPWEVHNLADDAAYGDVLRRMREAADQWMIRIMDVGFIPEGEYAAINSSTSLYDYARSGRYPIREIVSAANTAIQGNRDNAERLTALLKSDMPTIRYWAATGLLILRKDAVKAVPQLEEALRDTSPDVVIVAAEALYRAGETVTGTDALLKAINHPAISVRNHALNVVDALNMNNDEVKNAVVGLKKKLEKDPNPMQYDLRMAEWLMKKWDL
ncbi:MAG: sulfatase-like hydrolase/transferase [Tannerella sp.]|jgi:arylsulfatase A-like enzyme|nr:sulfatase-like hydrolase/transferase [Tannerella sp.]